ncbi:uncharacterized protein LOC117793784 [Drosophila innubila]|uniref:uncharacterized protein LOC117793784 n=1 Tax=Drosophila innubila TaxID=198719 RepID=UPI00148C82B3|nr:uncharacterized protein LOC117793784 [Drosophila innubila]
MPTTWERSITIKHSNKSRLFPDDGKEKRPLFIASFERKTEPAGISLLMGWEYGRQWLKERDEFLRQTGNSRRRFIENDYNWWLKKRQFVLERRKFNTRQQPNVAKPNHNLSAFAEAKKTRADTSGTSGTSGNLTCHKKCCKC